MRRFQPAFFAALLTSLLLTACQSSSVIIDYDTAADFSQYRSYHWLDERSGTAADVDPLMAARVKEAVASELGGKQFAPAAEGASPDVLVRYYVNNVVQSKESNTRGGIGIGGGGGSGGSGMGVGLSMSFPLGGSAVQQQVEIVVDLIEAGTDKLKWRGINRIEIQELKPDQITTLVNMAVAEMFAQYPPVKQSP